MILCRLGGDRYVEAQVVNRVTEEIRDGVNRVCVWPFEAGGFLLDAGRYHVFGSEGGWQIMAIDVDREGAAVFSKPGGAI